MILVTNTIQLYMSVGKGQFMVRMPPQCIRVCVCVFHSTNLRNPRRLHCARHDSCRRSSPLCCCSVLLHDSCVYRHYTHSHLHQRQKGKHFLLFWNTKQVLAFKNPVIFNHFGISYPGPFILH